MEEIPKFPVSFTLPETVCLLSTDICDILCSCEIGARHMVQVKLSADCRMWSHRVGALKKACGAAIILPNIRCCIVKQCAVTAVCVLCNAIIENSQLVMFEFSDAKFKNTEIAMDFIHRRITRSEEEERWQRRRRNEERSGARILNTEMGIFNKKLECYKLYSIYAKSVGEP